jgi:hypothetical protein
MAVAQTFVNNVAEGCFATSLNLYFSEKDSTQPVNVALIETYQNRPGSKILPFSVVTKAAADVNTSTDGETATTFTFPSPVYLKGGLTYAIAITSNSNKYILYVSELGQTVIGTTRRVSEQPAVGSLYKSQNVGGQQESPLQDIKFSLKKANFTENTTATVTFNNSALTAETLGNNPIETNATAGSGSTFGDNPAIIKINHPDHGMNDDKPDKVTIAGLTAATDYNGILGSAINGTHNIGNVTLDSYTITISGDTATSTGSVGGTSVTATKNVAFEALQPQIAFMKPDDASLSHSIITTSKQSIHGSETSYVAQTETSIVPNDNYYFTAQQQVASPINETTHFSGNKTLTYKMSMSTDNQNVSPVIDTGRANLITISNRLDEPSVSNTTGFVDETEGTGGSASAKYLTREILLDNPATALDVRISANNYPTSNIKLLYKIRHVDDSRPFDEIPYVYFNTTGLADDAITYSESRSQTPYSPEYNTSYNEQKFTADGLGEFTSFSIKMVMTGSNPAYPPRITDLRAIALAT